MSTYDAVVVGGGHNALVTAACLARAGRSVVVLETNDRVGGFVRTDELTLPGFRHDTYATAMPLFLSGAAWADLGTDLTAVGLEFRNTTKPTGVSLPDGSATFLSTDVEATIAEFERLAPGDGAALAALLDEFAPLAGPVFGLFAQDLAGAQPQIRELMGGDNGFSEFAHLFTMSARHLLEERFRSPLVRAMFAPWATHLGRGVDDANSGLWVILVLLALQAAGMPTPAGGAEQLALSLGALITKNGGEIRTGTTVRKIVLAHGRATGVETEDGEFIGATTVVASVNPDQLYLKLLAHEPDAVPPLIRTQAQRYRYGLGAVQVHLALSEPPCYPEPLAGVGQPHFTTGLNGVSKAINEAVRGLLPASPTISFDSPSELDPSRCPEGKAVARLQILEVPAVPRGDAADEIGVDGEWTEDVKNRFADRVVEIAGQHVPNLPDVVLGRYVISPRELAAHNVNSGPGAPYGGIHDLAGSYVFRPLPGQPSHTTTVPNVHLVGAGTWPGHGVNGGSGHIVARKLLD
ncbi:phytoene desaturase family protein [Lentzea sp. NPDC051213]|uniref:phytoene desaturase family protein n=1 Tax=Lentzea sp. NPDC051213 TaxID=3364126 RepID=UPI003789BFCB